MVALKPSITGSMLVLIDPDLSVLRRKGKKVDSPKKHVGHLGLARQLPNVLKRSGIVRLLATGSSILWCLPEAKSKGCLATFLERKTRFYLAFKIPDRTAKSMFSAIEQLCRLFPKEALKTFTSDRGKEFACYPLVENLGIPFFFADAYSSW